MPESRAGIDLVCVIDVSGSMSSNGKIDLVKKTLSYLLTIMNNDDRICLIPFESNANVVINLKRTKNENKEIIEKEI